MINKFVKRKGGEEIFLVKSATKCTYSCEYISLHGGDCRRELYTLALVSPGVSTSGIIDTKFLEPIERQCAKNYEEVKSW